MYAVQRWDRATSVPIYFREEVFLSVEVTLHLLHRAANINLGHRAMGPYNMRDKGNRHSLATPGRKVVLSQKYGCFDGVKSIHSALIGGLKEFQCCIGLRA